MTRTVKVGSTDVSVVFRVIDNADGTPETAVTSASAGLDLEYWPMGVLSSSVNITEVGLASTSSAHSDGGFIHIGNGYYRLDLPDAAVSTGAGVLIHGAVTSMVVIGEFIELVYYDPNDAVKLGLTLIGAITSGVFSSAAIDARAFSQAAANLVMSGAGSSMAELAQAAPAASPTPAEAMMAGYMEARNKLDITATFREIHNDAGTVVFKKALSDDGVTYSEAEAETGP